MRPATVWYGLLRSHNKNVCRIYQALWAGDAPDVEFRQTTKYLQCSFLIVMILLRISVPLS